MAEVVTDVPARLDRLPFSRFHWLVVISLGVTRILVGDLRANGLLDVHVLDDVFPDPETILRVIRGLRALS